MLSLFSLNARSPSNEAKVAGALDSNPFINLPMSLLSLEPVTELCHRDETD